MTLPLTALFIDCDAYFASVEQHLDPSLRGRPVGVAPVLAESSCCIAASYEAKAFGVKTGTRISDARILCPGIVIVESKPAEYIRHHHQVVAAVEDCIHVEAVLSIDEMWAHLPINLRDPHVVETIGKKIKASVNHHVSPVIKVSVGAGPNKFIAKMASKMHKPDGLCIIKHQDLPEILHPLDLRDITGIGHRMITRLHAAGIHTVESLCAAPKVELHHVWGGIIGDRLWHLLRGDEIPDQESVRRSIGHSHVLPPDSRAPDRAWPILCKLLHKACERLRAEALLAGALTLQLNTPEHGSWAAEARTDETNSTLTLMNLLGELWRNRPAPRARLRQVGIMLTRLCQPHNHTPSLFAHTAEQVNHADKHHRLDATLDQLRARYGRHTVYFGSVHQSRDHAPMRISFTHIPDIKIEGD